MMRGQSTSVIVAWGVALWVVLVAAEPAPPEAKAPSPGEEWTDPGIGMKFRYVPAGELRMGSPADEPWRDDDETLHDVELTRGFWMGETEVTQGQWESVMGNNPSTFDDCGEECPVDSVSWFDAVTFANRLSQKAGRSECYDLEGCRGTPGVKGYVCREVKLKALDCLGYRLPTEAEWEYAARAETTTPFWTGNSLPEDHANFDVNVPYSGAPPKEIRKKPVPVRSFEAHKWGLFEVHGNVKEWIWDWYGKYPKLRVEDPEGPQKGRSRVLRGGGWNSYAGQCRAATRGAKPPDARWNDVGFRLVTTVRKSVPET